jgi:hypothetical protein
MKAVIFSIGEPTTDLSVWSVERQGFDVTVVKDQNSLWRKLKYMLDNFDEDLLRVDADVICNGNIRHLDPHDDLTQDALWSQSHCFDWYKQSVEPCSVGVITKKALQICREHIDKFQKDSRPETRLWRLDEFHNPRRCVLYDTVVGLHGYGQNDLARIKSQKKERKQEYDWELHEAVAAL